MHEERVHIVDAQLLAQAVDVGPGHLGGGGPRLGLDEEPFARQPFEGIAQIDMRTVLVGGIEIGDAPVEGIAHQADEFLVAELDLVR